MEKQLVIFELANERYGVDIAAVESIIKMQPITAVPFAPHFVEGVTNLRGVVLPVIDLRKRFGLPLTEASRNTRIIIVGINGLTVGMIVDAVAEVLRVPDEAILLDLNQVLTHLERSDLKQFHNTHSETLALS